MADFSDGRGGDFEAPAPTAPQDQSAPSFQERVLAGEFDGPKAQAPTAPEAPAGKIQDDPVFKSLPRNIQKQVESGELDLAAASQAAAKGGGAAGQPAPQANTDNAPSQPLGGQGPAPVAGQQTTPNVPVDFAGGPSRLSAGQVLEGGRTGRDTFARPGSQGFKAFQGQEFNPFLLRPEAQGVAGGAALSARDALRTGDVGRQVVSSGGGTGFSLGGADDPFLKDLTGG